jgi:hypothetical protein
MRRFRSERKSEKLEVFTAFYLWPQVKLNKLYELSQPILFSLQGSNLLVTMISPIQPAEFRISAFICVVGWPSVT